MSPNGSQTCLTGRFLASMAAAAMPHRYWVAKLELDAKIWLAISRPRPVPVVCRLSGLSVVQVSGERMERAPESSSKTLSLISFRLGVFTVGLHRYCSHRSYSFCSWHHYYCRQGLNTSRTSPRPLIDCCCGKSVSLRPDWARAQTHRVAVSLFAESPARTETSGLGPRS